MEEQGLVGLEARSADGTEVMGRISEVITDEGTGEVTHVLVESEGGDQTEVPISQITLDPEADFATFGADASDVEPGDHVDDEVEVQGYAPNQSDVDDSEHEGQFVTAPTDGHEAGGFEDEASTTADSGYPRNDVYINPDTGDEENDPALVDNVTLKDDVEDLVNGTELGVRSEKEGVVELTGRAATQEDLDQSIAEIMGLDGVLDVDTTDVSVG